MAQIIKHRRGSIDSLKNSTSRKGELIMATGSIGNLNGPFVFIGTDEGSGLYSPASKLYAGTEVPTIVATTYGTTLDGTPFYATGEKSLYILNNSNVGNSKIDLSGNLEGTTISGVTINTLTSTNITASYFTGAFVGDASGLTNVPVSGLTGFDPSKIVSGSYSGSISQLGGFQVNTDTAVTGTIHIGDSTVAQIYKDGALYVEDHDNGVTIQSNNYAELQSSNAWIWVEGSEAYVEGSTFTKVYTDSGDVQISAYDGGTLYLNTDGGEGNINLGNNSNSVWGYTTVTNFDASDYAQLGSNNSYLWVDAEGAYLQNDSNGIGGFTARPNGIIEATGSLNIYGNTQISGNTSVTGALVVSNGSATFDQGLVAQNSNMLLTSGSNLIVQNNGNVTVDYIQGNTQAWNYLSLNGGVLGAPNVELSSAGDISLFAEGGTVNVTGSLKVTGDVTVEQNMYVSGNIYQTGSFYTQGDIVLSGSINIGNSLTGDTINFGGEVNSNILPTTGATYDLGSSGQTWNNVYAEYYYGDGSHLTNISLTGITGLNKIVDGAVSASILEVGGFQVNTDSAFTGSLSVSNTIYVGSTTSQIYNDGAMYVEDLTNGVLVRGGNSNKLELANNGYVNLYSNGSGVDIEANGGQLWLWSDYHDVNISSYDGSSLNLNNDGGEGNVNIGNGDNNLNIYSNTYINNGKALFVNKMWDNADTSNYLELYGYGTDDGYWWESGSGADTTLNNNWGGAHTNILNTNNGNVNIDATNGSVNLHSNNGFNVTGSMVVSDGSGVFNSSLIANNSNLTLNNGSNIEMNEGHIYFGDGCGDIYFNTGNNDLTLYNDCGNIRLENNLYTNNHIYIENDNYLYTNEIYGYNNGDLNIGADGAVYIYSDNNRWIELSTPNAESGTNYLYVNNDGVSFTTYDVTSNLTHKVLLDNTGSLRLENVAVGITGSLDISGSFNSYGVTHIHNDLYVSGNLSILGSGSVVHISSSQVDIGTNIINLNTYAPFERFAGISVYDSGSNAGVTGSILWDSQNDVWIYSNPSGSAYASARFIAGPLNTGSLGDETGLTNGHFPIAVADDHIADSLLTYQGTTLALNTNKFTVDSDSGAMMIDGNFTIHGVGATDNGTYSSYIVFKNDQDELGFVDTSDTLNVTDRLLGYNELTGNLEFSSLIDGGTY